LDLGDSSRARWFVSRSQPTPVSPAHEAGKHGYRMRDPHAVDVRATVGPHGVGNFSDFPWLAR